VDEPGRNDAFDRELRRTLAAGGGGTPGPHVDAELAAAWMDHRLDPAAARSVEAHLAGCYDCQAMFATLARIAPDEAIANEGLAWWRRLRAGWLVPATVAAAAALVIWVAVPQQRATPTALESVQSRDDRAQAPQPPATPQAPAPAAPEAKTAAPPAVARETDSAAAGQFAKPVPEPQRKTEALERAAPAPAAAAPAAPPASELERRDRLADAAAPPPVGSLKETIVVEGQTPAVDAQAARKATVAGAAPPSPPAPAAERQEEASAAQGRLLRQNAQLAAGLRAPAGLTIIAADGAARWRRAGPRIEFAPRADAGFTAVTLPAPADAIAAGSSPGGTVCWLAGSDGLVLVTTDGVRFARVGAPASASFVAVIASDARTATVTAADGRRFRTTDGGVTWAGLP
jgi:hypothetical protein